MKSITRRLALTLPTLAYLGSRLPGTARAQAAGNAPQDTDWRSFAADNANTRYSPLDQINGGNFDKLEVAWRFSTSPFGPTPELNLQCTPLVVKRRMYFTAGTRRDVVCIDAGTAEVLWVHRMDEGARATRSPRKLSGRGVSYWTDGTEERILYVTIGYQLVALDAKTGHRIPGFGQDGVVDLRKEDDQDLDPVEADVGLHAAPAIGNDVVVIGAAHTAGNIPRTYKNTKGYVRGYDVRTGKRLWIFHTIPQKGEFGYDTWLDGTENVGNAGVWGQISIDEQLNLAYLGVELPTGDANGQHRRGDALFGESIVAVDLKTGVRKWHYQMVHHGLWDYDVPCAAILLDIPHDGKIVKALAQPTKQAFLYVLNRETGKPIWPIPERKVPQGDVPGEWYSKTQPFPSKPPAFDRQGFGPDDVTDFTPEIKAKGLRLIKNYRLGPAFTPGSVFKRDGTWGTMTLPHLVGGANWPGGSADPVNSIVHVYSNNEADVMISAENKGKFRSDVDWVNLRSEPPRADGEAPTERDGFKPGQLTIDGIPLVKPPYGSITAIDLKDGTIKWRVAHGDTPDEVREHPALKGVTIPKTGQGGRVGTLTTKTLVICGDCITTTASGKRAAMLRAYDKETGEQKGAIPMAGPQSGCPMTFMLDGVQHIVLAIGGIGGNTFGSGNRGPNPPKSELICFRLPRA